MTQTHLASTYDLYINELVVLGSWVVLDFTTHGSNQTIKERKNFNSENSS